jgi:hypothetical protein
MIISGIVTYREANPARRNSPPTVSIVPTNAALKAGNGTPSDAKKVVASVRGGRPGVPAPERLAGKGARVAAGPASIPAMAAERRRLERLLVFIECRR